MMLARSAKVKTAVNTHKTSLPVLQNCMKRIDTKVKDAINSGEYYTTVIVSEENSQALMDLLESLGYDTNLSGENVLTIRWY